MSGGETKDEQPRESKTRPSEVKGTIAGFEDEGVGSAEESEGEESDGMASMEKRAVEARPRTVAGKS